MIINDLDCGAYSPFKISVKNFHTNLISIPGGYAVPYGFEGDPDEWKLRIWIKAPNAVGQYGAGTQAACEFLSRQLEEMVRNPDLQPLYLQFYAGTGVVALPQNFSQPQDGWYYVTQLTVDYTKSLYGFTVADFTVQSVSPGPPRRIGMATQGGALASTYNGAPTNWVAYPLNFQGNVVGTNATRTGADGGITLSIPPSINPAPFQPSATIADWFKGGVRVYDVMAVIATNPVPTGGTVTHANWIEVKGPDHRFVGDVVIHNGLQLWTFSPGASSGVVGYLWNTALVTPAWQTFATNLYYRDASSALATVRQVSLNKVGLDEVALTAYYSTTSPSGAQITFRLQRGALSLRADFRPLSQANSVSDGLLLAPPSGFKLLYNSGAASDTAVGAAALASTSDYGYAAGFVNNATYPFIAGFLYQNAPASQPSNPANGNMAVGDSSGPAQNATRSYGFFAIPFGSVSGATTVDKLQAECEGGTLSNGFTNAADATASSGRTAHVVSGNAVLALDTGIGATWTPPIANYIPWFRLKAESASGSSTAEFQLQVWNNTDGVAAVSLNLAPNAVTTSYAWYALPVFAPNQAKTYFFRIVQIIATTTVTWDFDEAVLAPYQASSGGQAYGFPQDLWQQFIYDRSAKQVLS